MSEIVSIRRVKNEALQAEIVGKVQRPGTKNVLALLNKGDDRFNTGNSRRAWFPVTMASLVDLGFSGEEMTKIEALKLDEKFTCSKVNPMVGGEVLEIQVMESINPNEYQRANTAKTAKQIQITAEVAANKGIKTAFDLSKYVGQNAYSLDDQGNYIFSRSTVTVASQVKHTFVAGELVPEKELGTFGATLAEPVSVGATAQA